MINVKDLMIGDWVKKGNLLGKVVNIEQRENIAVVGVEFNEGGYDVYYDDELEPIFVTTEILEKNGFESDNNIFGLCDYKLSENYILENRGDRFCFVKRIPRHYGTFYIIGIKYLHELQHVLKFFEIEREIKL